MNPERKQIQLTKWREKCLYSPEILIALLAKISLFHSKFNSREVSLNYFSPPHEFPGTKIAEKCL